MKRLSSLTTLLILTTMMALFYFSWDINSWKFSYVGDEWEFYSFTKYIVDHHFLVNPFSMQGVYGENPLLGSIYQALFVQLLGDTNFAWRFSNIILIVPCSIFFFLWIKKLFTPQIAFISTVLLQSSFFVSNYFKIGYVNPIAFTLFLVSLYAATLLAESPTKKHMLFLGITLGISFYIYLGPLFPLFVWPLLLPLIKKRKQFFPNVFYFFSSYILLVLPGIFDITHWHAAAKKTIFVKEFTDNSQIITNIFHNFFLYYKNYDYLYNHFIEGPYLDPITRTLALIGTILVIWNVKKNHYLALLLIYISVVVVIGITSPYAYTPTTRGIFFIPFGCIFAGIALGVLVHKKLYQFLLVPILFGIFALNFYHSQIGVFQKTGYSATSLILKELQLTNTSQQKSTYLLLADQQNFSTRNIPLMQEAYDLQKVTFTIISPQQLHCDTLNNNTVLYFANDETAKQTAKSLSCPTDKKILFKERNPTIFL